MTTQDESAQPAQQRPDNVRDTEIGLAGRAAEYRLRPHRHVGGPYSGGRPDRQVLRSGDVHRPETRAGAEGVDHRRLPTQRVPSTPARAHSADRVGEALGGVSRVETWLVGYLRRGSVPALRIALSLVFIWFGALKVTGETPVGKLVAGVAPWLPRELFVSGLGIFEVLLGIALLIGYRLVWVALLMVAHLTGTFLVFVTEPAAAFIHGNPLLVTMAGEFVAKNMVLIAAGLVLVAFAHEHAGSLHPGPLAEKA